MESDYNLTLTIKAYNWAKGGRTLFQDEPVIFNIRNESQTPVYIFDFFEVGGKPFSLGITIHNAEGKEILDFYNYSKVELCSTLKYVRLRQNGAYDVTFPFRLPKGEYTVTARY